MGPRVSLVNPGKYKDIVSEVYVLWHRSRCNDEILSVEDVNDLIVNLSLNCDKSSYMRASKAKDPEALWSAYETFGSPLDVFRAVVRSNIPVGEAILFTWVFEDISVAFREQLVRHRDYRVHQQDSYWSQSSRCRPLDEFFDEGLYEVPDAIRASKEASSVYLDLMSHIQDTYGTLKSLGIHQDDARMVFPSAMTHSISFHTNLRNIISLFKERSCWIAQASLWAPIISQMVATLSEIDPIFKSLVEPPCCNKGKFKGCPYPGDNDLRYKGKDPAPVCPLYAKENELKLDSSTPNFDQIEPMMDRHYREMWPSDLVDQAEVK